MPRKRKMRSFVRRCALCNQVGHYPKTCPMNTKRQNLNERIAKMRARGETLAAIAKEVGLAKVTVFRILRELDAVKESPEEEVEEPAPELPPAEAPNPGRVITHELMEDPDKYREIYEQWQSGMTLHLISLLNKIPKSKVRQIVDHYERGQS